MSEKRSVDTIISGGHLLTMDPAFPEYPDGAVAIDKGRFVGVGGRDSIEGRFTARSQVDATGTVIMPGLIDAYAHAGHGMIRGLFHPESAWPSHLYWTATTPDWWRADAELAALERLLAGVTTGQSIIGATPARADDTIFSDVTAAAYTEAGLRFVLGVGPPDPIFPHLPEPFTANLLREGGLVPHFFTAADATANASKVIQQWHGAAGGRIMAALAVPYLLGRHVVHRRVPNRVPEASDAPVILAHARQMIGLARDLGTTIHTHMFVGSVDYAIRHFGHAEVDTILSACPIVIAHANGLPQEEINVIARHKNNCGIASVAFTHENLWYGFAPIPAFRRCGIPVAITTDGAAPYTSYDLWRELSRTAWNQWQSEGNQSILPPETLLAMVTIEAARVLGLQNEIGSIEVGKKADVIVIDMQMPHIGPVHDVAQALLLYASAANVRDVLVDGEVLLRNRVAHKVNSSAIQLRAKSEASNVFRNVDLGPYRRPGAWQAPTEWPRPLA